MIFKNIKKRAEEKGYSISFVEREAGLGNGTIGKWKTGSATTENLAAVAKVLECTVDDLLHKETSVAEKIS